MEHENQEILKKLNQIQIDINFIKNNMMDADCIITNEERFELKKAREEYKRGETTSLEYFEKERMFMIK
jgi:hypothetical protein